MAKKLTLQHMDIYQYPTNVAPSLGEITIGDLHGNVVKLLHFLMRHGVVGWKSQVADKAAAYQSFVQIYDRFAELLKFRTLMKNLEGDEANREEYERLKTLSAPSAFMILIRQFHDLMNQLEILDAKTMERLLGDEVADRGSCDYLTFRLLKLLFDAKVDYGILISNHGVEFLANFSGVNLTNSMAPDMKLSFLGLKLLLDEGIVDKAEVDSLVRQVYLPKLKLMDYGLSGEGISLYTHAPVPFSLIAKMAERLKVPYDDSTKEALAATIDNMNKVFGELLQKGQWQDLLLEESSPLYQVIWNRWNEEQDIDSARPSMVKGYALTYSHGHDNYQSKFPHVINLDTLSGKGAHYKETLEMQRAVKALAVPETKDAAQLIIHAHREHSIDSDELRLGAYLKHQEPHPSSRWALIAEQTRQYAKRLGHLFEREKKPVVTPETPVVPKAPDMRYSYQKIVASLGGRRAPSEATTPSNEMDEELEGGHLPHPEGEVGLNPTQKNK